MRRLIFLALPIVFALVLDVPAQSKKTQAKNPYQVEFDPGKDVSQLERAPDGKEGIYIKVRFAITLDGAKVDKLEGDYKIVIEEDG